MSKLAMRGEKNLTGSGEPIRLAFNGKTLPVHYEPISWSTGNRDAPRPPAPAAAPSPMSGSANERNDEAGVSSDPAAVGDEEGERRW